MVTPLRPFVVQDPSLFSRLPGHKRVSISVSKEMEFLGMPGCPGQEEDEEGQEDQMAEASKGPATSSFYACKIAEPTRFLEFLASHFRTFWCRFGIG